MLPNFRMLDEVIRGFLRHFEGFDVLSLHLFHHADEVVGVDFHLIPLSVQVPRETKRELGVSNGWGEVLLV